MAPDVPFENRELAWLAFNNRVLEEAEDPAVPLLERVKFLGIFSSNLDEFFMVRVAGLWRQVKSGSRGPDGRTPREALDAVSRRVHALVARQHRVFAKVLVPALREVGVRIVHPSRLDRHGRAYVSQWFAREVLPVLTPMAIDPGHPFPHLTNRAICLIADLIPLEGGDALPRATRCVIHLPAAGLPRFLRVPGPGHRFVLLEDVVRAHLDQVLSNYEVRSASVIRVTRDAEFDLPEDDAAAEDLLQQVQQGVRSRRLGDAVRLQYEADLSPDLLELLCHELELDPIDLYPTTGPTGLTDVMQLYGALDLPELRDPVHHPRPVPGFEPDADVFATIRAGDVLVHHPYQDFDAVTRFVEAAADDAAVVAIKMTLYRVSNSSRIAEALARAAENGKEVAVLVELRARFSEEGNITWARRLEDTGAHVVYGLTGLKTHCKAALVVRREHDGLRRYVHLGTGNYNHSTARLYTDLGVFTADPELAQELTHVFNLLTGYVRPPPLHLLVLAPTRLRAWILERVQREAEHARAGRPSGILVKLNALADPEVVRALYAASEAGVPIRLIIRGICCLRPGLPGWSSRIEAIRLVDRFLEHARVIRFENGGDRELWLSSADWMPRNLNGRIEVTWQVRDPLLVERIDAMLEAQWADTVKARRLDSDGVGHRRPGPPRRAQTELVEATRRLPS